MIWPFLFPAKHMHRPHPEERAFARVSKDGGIRALMVRDGASAPPHHEASADTARLLAVTLTYSARYAACFFGGKRPQKVSPLAAMSSSSFGGRPFSIHRDPQDTRRSCRLMARSIALLADKEPLLRR